MSTERPSKRLRSSPPPTPHEARNRYLDAVPDDILRIVLRYLSRRPQHENWHAYISADSVNTVLDVGGALGRAALMELDVIGGTNGIVLPPLSGLDVTMLRSLVSRLPPRKLVLQLPRRVVWICTPGGVIHESRGGDLLSRLLPECGAELRELVLDTGRTAVTESDILAISTHCTKLSALVIGSQRIEGVLAPIWHSLGSTLTRICIGSCHSGIISAPDLVEHCVSLSRVDVQGLDNELAGVLVALGSRIRVLGIQSKLFDNLALKAKVYAACTNLKAVHLALDGSLPGAINVLSLMRTKLSTLALRDLAYRVPIEDQFFSVLSDCSVLKNLRLDLYRLPLDSLRKLFENLKSVTSLTLSVGHPSFGNSPKKDVIDVLAGNLRNLESLSISTCQSLKGEDVHALAALPLLKFVTLRCVVSKPSERCVVEVVKTLQDCSLLVQLEIDGVNFGSRSQIIAAAAVKYRRKDFDMFIGGVQYRTW